MAIKNIEIIALEMMSHGITETVNTYDGWKRKGFQVQKGEKALFATTIWKPCKVKTKAKESEGETRQKLLLVKAAFFGFSQVKEIN